ncbi:MAG TPA: glucose-6-phosphate isomerase [Longimicrobiales bacterium]
MPERIMLDYNNMMAAALGGRGIADDLFAQYQERFRAVHEAVEGKRTRGEIGFFKLTDQQEVVREIRGFAEGIGQAFDTVVVLGIGGSALGTLALQQALLKPHWNELTDEQREYFPRLYVLDNVDPSTIGPLLERLDLRRTLFNVVSKSGTTAETMAQFLIVYQRLRAAFGDDQEAYRSHLLFTTDPEKGVLRELARAENIPTLPIPPDVGGRFSVLSAVGLLPAALVGIDVQALLDGAQAMAERCAHADLTRNPAGIFACLQHAADAELKAPIHVMLSYSDRLYLTADWFRQLWAESLGKDNRGPTPVKALGATDQHSQVQLYMEGPFDKTITILAVGERDSDVPIPQAYQQVDALAYLGGHTLGELLDAERRATAHALAQRGRMNMTLELPRLNAHVVGQTFMMLQIATVYAGALYGVNPFDQPGVELGKELTYGYFGRAGYRPPETGSSDPHRIVQ